jgi:hypothetical protein
MKVILMKLNLIEAPDDDDKTQPIAPQRTSLVDKLFEQLYLLELSEEEMILGELDNSEFE